MKTTSSVTVVSTRPAETLRKLSELQAQQLKAMTVKEKAIIASEVRDIYISEISGKDEVLNTPIKAADSTDANLGTLAGTLAAMRTIEDYEQQLVPAPFLSTDYSDESAQFGQTSTTRIVVMPGVQSYDPTLDANGYPIGWVISTPAQTIDVPVTINQHKGVPIVFNANQVGGTLRDLFGEQDNLAGYALALDVNSAILALITPDNFPGAGPSVPTVVQQSDFGRGTFTQAASIFNPIGVPIPRRACLMNSQYFAQLSQDPTLVSLAAFQKPEIITDAELPQISKFQPLEASYMPGTNNLAAFFLHRSALVIKTRLPQDYTKILPGASYGNVAVVTGKSGLSMLMVQYVNHNGGYTAWRIAIMYGVAAGNTKGGWIIKSAA